jgi:GMP synthase-like glutamine amidotransferase
VVTGPANPAGSNSVRHPRIVVLEHSASDPGMLLGDWLAEAGGDLQVLRPYAGDEVPGDLTGIDALLCLGGPMGAYDDEVAPWLPATRQLLASAAAGGTPTLGVCLGGQLLAAATGGLVERGQDGPERGAYLVAKRDAAEADPLFAGLPLSPDVMQYHYDVISELPPGAVLLLSSTGYPNQAFRVGAAAWGIQFHIEVTAEILRAWARHDPAGTPPSARFGPMLDEAEELMGQVWRAFSHRFVELARDGVPATPTGHPGPRLPLLAGWDRDPEDTGGSS